MSNNNRLYSLLLCSLFAALCAIGAFIKVPLAWLPITLQTFFSTLAGLLLGEKWGSFSICLYLGLGLIGFPVFTQGGGLGYVLKPSFGFLLALLPATFLTGFVYRRTKQRFSSAFCASLLGTFVIYAIGLPYLYLITNFYLGQTLTVPALFAACFLPTLPGDVLKCVVCALVSTRLAPILSGTRSHV